MDDAAHLKQFLAAVTQQRQQKDPVVWNTYLELTLRPDLLQENEDRDAAVLHLLKRPDAAYESDEALILLQRYHCEQGLVYLFQKLHMQAMLLQQYYHMGRRAEALALCQQNGKEEPEPVGAAAAADERGFGSGRVGAAHAAGGGGGERSRAAAPHHPDSEREPSHSVLAAEGASGEAAACGKEHCRRGRGEAGRAANLG